MIALNSNPNVDNSDLINFPDGRIQDNNGTGNGTGVNRNVYGDLHANISKLMRLYGINPSGQPDNETNGYQIIEALSALASKNDYIYPLTTSGGILNVGVKLTMMKTNEFLVCLAATNLTTETQINGIGTGSFAVTYSGVFKANEYVRLIKTSAGVSIIRVADWNSLDAMAADLLYLKKATQAEENAGLVDTKATTPLVNLVAFTRRVIGADSANFLATNARNGLLSLADKAKLDGLIIARNIGWFSSIDCGGGTIGAVMPHSGNILNAVVFSVESSAGTGLRSSSTTYIVTMTNAMNNSDYEVASSLQSEGTLNTDNDVLCPVYQIISPTQFYWTLSDIGNPPGGQSIKAHLKVTQL